MNLTKKRRSFDLRTKVIEVDTVPALRLLLCFQPDRLHNRDVSTSNF